MTPGDVLTLAPVVVLSAMIILVMLLSVLTHSHALVLGATLLGLAATLACIPVAASREEREVTQLVVLDDFGLFFIGLITAATAAVAIMSYGYLSKGEEQRLDYYTLLLLATLGAVTLVISTHFATFFIGLEILSVSLYVLIAYPRRIAASIEAGVKYLILAAATAAALLFGMALVYATTGRMSLVGLVDARTGDSPEQASIFVAGLILILVGVGYKLALVPFHMWTPDVYQGAPAPVAAFIATASKAGVAAILLRFLRGQDIPIGTAMEVVLWIVAVGSMVAGNLLALLQTNVKRILAYSSIAHLGYLLVPFVAGGRTAAVAVLFYLVAYVVTMLGAFGIVTMLSSAEREAEEIEDYRELGLRRPLLAGTFTVVLLSLAGIPLTAGFIGKFYLVTAGAGTALWALLIVLVLTSTISLYYYTRVIIAMYVRRGEVELAPEPIVGPGMGTAAGSPAASGAPALSAPAARPAAAFVLGLLILAVLALGVYPGPMVDLIEHAVRSLL